MDPAYLKNCLTPVELAWREYGADHIGQRISSGRIQEKSLFYHGSRPLEPHALMVRSGPTLLAFQKAQKTWLCQLTWALHFGGGY